MNSSQIAGFCVLAAIFGYPALLSFSNFMQRRRDRRILKRMAERRY